MTINKFLHITYLVLICYSNTCFSASSLPIDADVVIINGQLIDGTGKPRFVADIAVKDGRIIYIGNKNIFSAKKTINAKGLIVAPGFIDGHSHTGEYMFDKKNRFNESMLFQGVTTIVFGADGMFSPNQLTTFFENFKKNGTGTNVGFYVGHNGIRSEVMGKDQRREPSNNEIIAMKELVKKGMEMGAVGISTGLMYEPGMFSKTQEVIEISKVVANYGGIYDSHIRDPVHELIQSVQEVVDIGAGARIAAKVAHVKAVCLDNAGKTQDIINIVNLARSQGQNIVTDQYPYDGAKTDFLDSIILLPKTLNSEEIITNLKDKNQRDLIRNVSENGINGGFSWLKAAGYSCIRITYSEDYPQYVGHYLSEIAQSTKSDNFDTVAELLIGAKKEIRITLGGVKDLDVEALMIQPWNMIVSDGKYINEHSSPRQHPRSTGTFPKVLGKYVRDKQLLTLEKAIKKMSSQPADFLGFSDRGRIIEGNVADIVIFDEQKIIDRSTWAKPLLYADGVRYVFINGAIALDHGVLSASPLGQVIKRTDKTSKNIELEHE